MSTNCVFISFASLAATSRICFARGVKGTSPMVIVPPEVAT